MIFHFFACLCASGEAQYIQFILTDQLRSLVEWTSQFILFIVSWMHQSFIIEGECKNKETVRTVILTVLLSMLCKQMNQQSYSRMSLLSDRNQNIAYLCPMPQFRVMSWAFYRYLPSASSYLMAASLMLVNKWITHATVCMRIYVTALNQIFFGNFQLISFFNFPERIYRHCKLFLGLFNIWSEWTKNQPTQNYLILVWLFFSYLNSAL